jgi:hypothetical protein
MTVLKVMLTAITVGSIGIFALGQIRLDDITPVPAWLWIGLLVVATWLSHRLFKDGANSREV